MNELVDDTQIIHDLYTQALPGVTVMQQLFDTAHDYLPVLMFDLNGSDAEWTANGPGLWNSTLDVWIFAESEQAAWELSKRVHSITATWDIPGEGYFPGVGGVERVETIAKFSRPFDSDMFDKAVSQAQASYACLIRTNY